MQFWRDTLCQDQDLHCQLHGRTQVAPVVTLTTFPRKTTLWRLRTFSTSLTRDTLYQRCPLLARKRRKVSSRQLHAWPRRLPSVYESPRSGLELPFVMSKPPPAFC